MKYVEYKFTYKNGIVENYTVEIPPHELEECTKGISDINEVINAFIRDGKSGVVKLDAVEGYTIINTAQLQSAVITELENLQ